MGDCISAPLAVGCGAIFCCYGGTLCCFEAAREEKKRERTNRGGTSSSRRSRRRNSGSTYDTVLSRSDSNGSREFLSRRSRGDKHE